MSTYNISTWTHNTVYIYTREREIALCIHIHSPIFLKNTVPQNYCWIF